MTPTFCCGFECGASGAHWTPSGTGAFATSGQRTGSRALRANPTASTLNEGATSVALTAATARIWVLRAYVKFTTLPNTDTTLFGVIPLTATLPSGAFFKASDSKIYAGVGGSGVGATGVSVTTGEWYRVDVKVDLHSNPWLINVQVDGVACGQKSFATALDRATGAFCYLSGNGSAVTADVYWDDFLISLTDTDYPLGSGYVNHFIPTSDGTHNVAGAADFQRTLTGTDILNATTTAFQLVDDVPLETGASVDWINMIAPPNATDYVECVFGPASGILAPTWGPRAVEVVAGIHQAGTGTGNMEIRINDNGTTNAMYTATTVAGVTSVAFKRAHYATAIAGGGAWTVVAGNGNFNNLRVRFGSPAAVDANPDQYFDCIMVEAEFPYKSLAPDYNITPRFYMKKRVR